MKQTFTKYSAVSRGACTVIAIYVISATPAVEAWITDALVYGNCKSKDNFLGWISIDHISSIQTVIITCQLSGQYIQRPKATYD